MKIRIATRRSALALAQTRQLAALLRALDNNIVTEELQVVTEGDRVQDRSLAEVGGKGLFVHELERALLEGRADLAVHSLKDLPVVMPEALVLAAVPERESPFDLLVTRDGAAVGALPEGARVGSSSLRRGIQLRLARPDLRVEMLRGNVDTRLKKLAEGAFDAIVLAEAGLRRLGLRDSVRGSVLEGVLVPSIGQGALGLQCRGDDEPLRTLLARLEHGPSRVAVEAERAVLRELGGDCTTPVGALATLTDHALVLRGFLADREGKRSVFADARGPATEAHALGSLLAVSLRERLAQS